MKKAEKSEKRISRHVVRNSSKFLGSLEKSQKTEFKKFKVDDIFFLAV